MPSIVDILFMLDEKKYIHEVATKIRKARIAKKKSQEDLAFDVEISRTYLGEIESGLRNPSIFVLKKICMALDIKIGDIAD